MPRPIACTLTADELPGRVAEARAIGAASLMSVDQGVAAWTLRFRADPETRRRLEALIAAESRCCAFLTFELRDEPEGLALTVGGPEEAQPVLADLVRAFG